MGAISILGQVGKDFWSLGKRIIGNSDNDAEMADVEKIEGTILKEGEDVVTKNSSHTTTPAGKGIVPQVRVKPATGKKGRGKGQLDAKEMER